MTCTHERGGREKKKRGRGGGNLLPFHALAIPSGSQPRQEGKKRTKERCGKTKRERRKKKKGGKKRQTRCLSISLIAITRVVEKFRK